MLVLPRARPAARVHGRLGAGPHHLRRQRAFSGAGAPQSLNSDEAGPARRLRDSDQDRGAGPGSRTVLRPLPRHPLLKVTLERSFMCRAHGPRDPFLPCIRCKPHLCCSHASNLFAVSRVLSNLIFIPHQLLFHPACNAVCVRIIYQPGGLARVPPIPVPSFEMVLAWPHVE